MAVAFVAEFESTPTVTETALIAAYSTLMMVVCLLACIVPMRRALRVEPDTVLKLEG